MVSIRPFLFAFIFSPRYQQLKLRLAFSLYLAVIVLGSIPGARADVGEVASGWVLHSLTYSGLTFLLFTGREGSARFRMWTAVLTIAVMGAFDEFVQSFFPYRTASVVDWFIDVNAGSWTAAVLWWAWHGQQSSPCMSQR